MTQEDRLQKNIVRIFKYMAPREDLFFCRTENKTDKGAYYKNLGLTKGMTDIKYTSRTGKQILIELKAQKTRHDIEHLKEQLNFIEEHQKRGCLGIFIFSVDHFQTFMANILNDITINALTMCNDSQNYIQSVIKNAEAIGNKTALLYYDYKELHN